jgi:putative isomerase
VADLSPLKLHLEPKGKASLVILLGFGRYRGEARDAFDAAATKIANGWTSAKATDRIQELLRKAPPLAAKYRGQEKFERLYAHAITALSSLCIRGEGGYTGTKRIPYTTKFGLACAFFWDTSFSSVGLREFDTAAAQEAISCFTENAGPRGSLPGTLCDSHRAGEGQAPIMSWASWLIYQRSRDKVWLNRVYPALAGNNRFWFKYHASSRGLCQFFNAGQIADDDARFDVIQGDKRNWTLRGFESPDLNAFLVMDCRSLATMADELGLPDEAKAWREQADRLAEKIVETMYFPDDAIFFDVKTGTREKLSGVKTPNMFLPLWAAIPLKKEQIGAIVERHMLNPQEFYRDLPFPSLSYDNPKYEPAGYWRGRIWPHVVYWMAQTLWRQGYHKEAGQTADRLLALLQKTSWLHENYESGQGGGIGCPNYNWTCATAIELLLERYKDPLP